MTQSKYCSCVFAKSEWAVSNELVTLIAAAVAATDEWSTTAGHVCVCGRARLSEQEL